MNTADTQARVLAIAAEIEALKAERESILQAWADTVEMPIKIGDVIPYSHGGMKTARVTAKRGAVNGYQDRIYIYCNVRPLRADGQDSKGYTQGHSWYPPV